MTDHYPPPTEEAMRDMLTCRVRPPDLTDWTDEVYAALFEAVSEQFEAAADLKDRLEAEHKRALAGWATLTERACAVLASGDLHQKDQCTAAAMTLSPWLQLVPIALERAVDRWRKLDRRKTELSHYVGVRALEADRLARQAELQRQAEAKREAELAEFLQQNPGAQRQYEQVRRAQAEEQRMKDEKAARQAVRGRQLAELEAEARAEVEELLSGPPKGKGK